MLLEMLGTLFPSFTSPRESRRQEFQGTRPRNASHCRRLRTII